MLPDPGEEKDTANGRRSFVERLDQWAVGEHAEKAGLVQREEQSLQSTLRRGWYWGSESFREKLVERFGGSIAKDKDRELRSSELFKSHDRQEADEILREAERYFGESMEELRKPKYGDLRRVAVAWALTKRTTTRQSEIAELTGLRTAANVSQRARRFGQMDEKTLSKELRKWRREYSNFVN